MFRFALVGCLLLFALPTDSASVRAIALFANKALLVIDGQRHMLSVGQGPVAGVRLIKSNSKQAVVDIEGVRRTLLVGQFADVAISKSRKVVTIKRNQQGQFIAKGFINQKPASLLVDTGANVVAMNSLEAKRMGIDYQKGNLVPVGTASEQVNAYLIKLATVQIGEIKASNIEATVHEGSYPKYILLGMSFLEHVNMKEKNGVMTLESK